MHLHPRGAEEVIPSRGTAVEALRVLPHPGRARRALALEIQAIVVVIEPRPGCDRAERRARPRGLPLPRSAPPGEHAYVTSRSSCATTSPRGTVESAVRHALGRPLAEDVQSSIASSAGAIPAGHTSLAFRVALSRRRSDVDRRRGRRAWRQGGVRSEGALRRDATGVKWESAGGVAREEASSVNAPTRCRTRRPSSARCSRNASASPRVIGEGGDGARLRGRSRHRASLSGGSRQVPGRSARTFAGEDAPPGVRDRPRSPQRASSKRGGHVPAALIHPEHPPCLRDRAGRGRDSVPRDGAARRGAALGVHTANGGRVPLQQALTIVQGHPRRPSRRRTRKGIVHRDPEARERVFLARELERAVSDQAPRLQDREGHGRRRAAMGAAARTGALLARTPAYMEPGAGRREPAERRAQRGPDLCGRGRDDVGDAERAGRLPCADRVRAPRRRHAAHPGDSREDRHAARPYLSRHRARDAEGSGAALCLGAGDGPRAPRPRRDVTRPPATGRQRRRAYPRAP